jgi:hypothetical protein
MVSVTPVAIAIVAPLSTHRVILAGTDKLAETFHVPLGTRSITVEAPIAVIAACKVVP